MGKIAAAGGAFGYVRERLSGDVAARKGRGIRDIRERENGRLGPS
jgi:hypothetical protein